VLAAGWTNGGGPTPAVPAAQITKIDFARNDGLMVFGAFGNPGTCLYADAIWIRKDHPNFKMIHTTLLAAQLSGKRIYTYIFTCESVLWYSTTLTFNLLSVDGSIALVD
jgi:hypothetical protein